MDKISPSLCNFFECLDDPEDGEDAYRGLMDQKQDDINDLLEELFAAWFKKMESGSLT